MNGLLSPFEVNGKISIYFNGTANISKESMRYHAEVCCSRYTYNKQHMKNRTQGYIFNVEKIKIRSPPNLQQYFLKELFKIIQIDNIYALYNITTLLTAMALSEK